ncbi:DUF898 family protein [Pseudoponticoccus marisrubri]|uniref:Uncharacterized protein n=1 Tax=Pseudoponticoccus marisrubri TaxID=1685382 RepID=A0A0W7WHL8_9RHOB|nr:DUF898 family protein [Pseudoponticoccus marisrubri]KUF10081.1 hypothetical protein AVJ23_13585 [Pseudoponticoccus marisrubri]
MHTDQDPMGISYNGVRSELFGLAFRTGLLTVVTLGIYRFWQKTRIRKYIWSSVNAGGDTFEYTGTGLEKLLGFLVAVVFLAVYLGIIQIALFYFGLNIMVDPEEASQAQIIGQVAAIYISFFAVLPFLLFAVYRARRYKMARTRFRGIRCGMEKGAWGYVLRALGYMALQVVTLGVLTPLQTFRLEKYQADRSFYGSQRMVQTGKWTDLYRYMKHIFIGLGLLVLAAVSAVMELYVLAGVAGAVGYVWVIVGAVHYGVQSFGYLMRHKTLGEVGFTAEPATGQVIKTYILGGLLLGVLASVIFGMVGAVVAAFAPMLVEGELPIAFFALLGVAYIVALVMIQALSLVLITQPILAHYISTIRVTNPQALNRIAQREAETGVDAEGFADALDIGGAI